MEKLEIKNFAGITNLEITFSPITILIGPQGVGKSIIGKLRYWAKELNENIGLCVTSDNKTLGSLKKFFLNKFIKYFPTDSWPQGNFTIKYSFSSDYSILFSKKENKRVITFSKKLNSIITNIFEQKDISRTVVDRMIVSLIENKSVDYSNTTVNLFVPASRSFISLLGAPISEIFEKDIKIEPFLRMFGMLLQSYIQRVNIFNEHLDQETENIINQLINGSLGDRFDRGYVMSKDNRKVKLKNASSGQQEVSPLIESLFLFLSNMLNFASGNLIIEEPEVHLYPRSQKLITRLIIRSFLKRYTTLDILITTHSPYILASFNNHIQAGRLVELMPEKVSEITEIIPAAELLFTNQVTAYSVTSNGIKSLMDEETGLISSTILDDVSNEISKEFGQLLDIEFDNE